MEGSNLYPCDPPEDAEIAIFELLSSSEQLSDRLRSQGLPDRLTSLTPVESELAREQIESDSEDPFARLMDWIGAIDRLSPY